MRPRKYAPASSVHNRLLLTLHEVNLRPSTCNHAGFTLRRSKFGKTENIHCALSLTAYDNTKKKADPFRRFSNISGYNYFFLHQAAFLAFNFCLPAAATSGLWKTVALSWNITLIANQDVDMATRGD